jgi:hypothetical protein
MLEPCCAEPRLTTRIGLSDLAGEFEERGLDSAVLLRCASCGAGRMRLLLGEGEKHEVPVSVEETEALGHRGARLLEGPAPVGPVMSGCDHREKRLVADLDSVTGFDLALMHCACGAYIVSFYWGGSLTDNELPAGLRAKWITMREGVRRALEATGASTRCEVRPPDPSRCDLCEADMEPGEGEDLAFDRVGSAFGAGWRPPRRRSLGVRAYHELAWSVRGRDWHLCPPCARSRQDFDARDPR